MDIIQFSTLYNKQTKEFIKGIIQTDKMTYHSTSYKQHLDRAMEIGINLRLEGEFESRGSYAKV